MKISMRTRLAAGLVVMSIILSPGWLGASEAVQVDIPDTAVSATSPFSLPVIITKPAGEQVLSVSFTLNCDAAILQATGISSAGSLTEGWGSSYRAFPGGIRVALAGSRPLPTGGTLVYVEFAASGTQIVETTPITITDLVLNEDPPQAEAAQATIKVCPPPQANFDALPTSGNSPLTVQFTDRSTGVIGIRQWSFGDGSTGNAPNPSHIYTTAGNYTVSLTVTGPGGTNTNTRAQYINVAPPPPPPSPVPAPQASFTLSPASGVAPLTVQLTNTSTNATEYDWFLPGGTLRIQNPPPQTFSQPGTYTIRLVAYSAGGRSEAAKTVAVYARAQAEFTVSKTQIPPGGTVAFTDASTGDINSWSWSFGDGQASTERNPSHTYTTAGTYTVSLTVSGPGGTSTAVKTGLILVANKAPVISPAIPGFTAIEGVDLVVDLSAYETDDFDGPAALRWSATVIEGVKLLVLFNTEGGAEDLFLFRPKPQAFGEVRVKFTLTDSQGASTSQEVVLTWTAKADPPVVTDPSPADRATGIPLSVLLRWKASDPDPGDVLTFAVSVGKTNPPGTVVAQDLKQSSFLLTNLDQRSTYFWQVEARDSFGLTAKSPAWRFTTVADEEPPVITQGPAVVGITSDGATVQWNTDEASTSLVEYSTEGNLSNAQQVSDASLTTAHSVALTGLTAGTTYHYRISSKDASGNLSKTKAGQFKTLATVDVWPPKILKGPMVVGLTTAEATVQWSTDEASTSLVEYSTEGNLSNAQQVSDVSLTTEHSVALTGLTAGTTYHYRISSKDASGNLSNNRAGQFKTLKVVDALPPKIIRGPVVQGITVDGATVQWSTDEAGTSLVEYGTTAALGSLAQDPQLVNNHSVVLTGLEAAATYYYRVLSNDASGNQGVSPQSTFKTLKAPDLLPPIIVSGPTATGITENSAVIRWTTDEISTSRVEFGRQPNLSDAQTAGSEEQTLVHTVTLANLEAKSTYNYRVSSTDVNGNASAAKAGNFKTLAAQDLAPPKIVSGPALTAVSDNAAQLEWKTNEDADALVEFGVEALDQSVSIAELQRKQSISLTNLLPATKYSYRISYADQSGNRSVSPQYSFTTTIAPDLKPPVITAGPVTAVRLHDQVVIEWSTDENSDSEVAFGSTAAYGSGTSSAELATKHSLRLVNLEPATTYHYQVRSKDINGNGPAQSGDRTFTTRAAPDNTPPKITGVPVVAERTDVSALIAWTTDELADGFVECSGDNGDQQVAGSEEGVLSHSVKLTNLQPGVSYRCKIQSTDVSGNGPTIYSGTLTFTTKAAPDVLPPVIVSSPFVVNVTTSGATVRWVTDEPSDSHLYYGDEAGNYEYESVLSEDERVHTVSLSNLEPGTLYYCKVGSIDGSDNGPVLSREFTCKTPSAPDLLPPVLVSGPAVRSVTSVSALIEWTTDEPANTVLDYGTSLSYEAGHLEQGEPVGLHQVFLTNLQAGTIYHYKVSSADANGNTVSSAGRDHTFRTARVADLQPPVFLEGPVVFRSDEGAVIQWTTDEPSGFEIIFDSDPGLGSPAREVIQSNELDQKHAARLTRLQRGKRYFYQLKVWDQDGNTRVAANNSSGGRVAKLAQAGQSFVTLLEPDVQVPVLLNLPKVSAATSTSMTIEWDTDELSDSAVEFGTETGALDQAAGSPLAVTHHQVILTNLTPGQAYRYRVNSTDISGNGPAQGPALAAKTSAEVDLSPPTIVGTPQLAGLTDTWATIEWVTDEVSTSAVDFGVGELENRREDPELVRQHHLTVTNLNPETTYRFKVSSTDGSQNGPTTSGESTFKTQALPDLAAPRITGNPRVLNRTNLMASLAWETDELSDSFVKYGLRAEALDQTAGSSATAVEHRISLTNLKPATTYFYQVSSVDRNNNGPTESAVYQFATAESQDATPPAAPAGVMAHAGSESVWVSWTAGSEPDIAGYNIYRREVVYPRRVEIHVVPPSVIPAYQLPEEKFQLVAALVQDPKYLDKGLKNGRLYDYQVTALDNAFPPNESPVSEMVQVVPAKDKVIAAPLASGVVSNPLVTTLEIFNVSSPSKNALTYMFQVATDSAFSDLVASVGRVAPATGAATSWTFASALEKGRGYWWRARANDGFFDGLWMDPTRFEVTGIAGDFSGDELVSFDDFFLFADQFGKKAGRANWKPQYDLNGNGVVDYDDFFLFADHFGEGRGVFKPGVATAPAAGPELQPQLHLVSLTPERAVLRLEVERSQSLAGAGLVLRHMPGVMLQFHDSGVRLEEAGANNILEGVLNQTTERTSFGIYRLAGGDALPADALCELVFELPPGAVNSEIVLEELWTLSTQRQQSQLRNAARVRLVPQAYALDLPYPNPFNPTVQIPYALPGRANVAVQIYNALGQRVRTLVRGEQEAGFYRVSWDGRDEFGREAGNGLYFVRIEAGTFHETRKLLMVK